MRTKQKRKGNDWLWLPIPILSSEPRTAACQSLSQKITQWCMQRMVYAFLLAYLLIGLNSLAIDPIYANPVGGTVVGGQATIVDSPKLTQINQSTDKAIINWQGFSIAADERTTFNQPSTSSIALNRVVGNDPSSILGQLTANGQVMLINPAGIVFGQGSRVDVGGLVATTANIRDEDFMSGNLHFVQSPDHHAAVINNGTIHAAENGLVALVGPAVQNNGTIEARLGRVTLGSSNEYTVDLYGDQLINFNVNAPVTVAAQDDQGLVLKDAVANKGAIYADGGRVVLSAHVAKGVVDHAINMDGIIQARSVSMRNGEVVLSSSGDGAVRVAGKIDVSGRAAHQYGGKVKVLGRHVILAKTATIDAAGAAGGGEVLIGGNYQGKGPEMNATQTTVEQGAVIDASATEQGNGGKVIIWSDGATDYDGSILATGGTQGGDGGFAEVSGKQLLAYKGEVDLRAPWGATGTLLLDPEDLTIQNAGPTTATASGSPTNTYTSASNSSVLTVSDLQNALANASVLVQTRSNTSSPGTGVGDINVANSLAWTSANTLTLSAYRNINFAPGISITNTGPGGGNVVLRTDSTGTGTGTFAQISAGAAATINLANSSNTVKAYYNAASFGTPDSFNSIFTVGTGTLTSYMLIHTAAQLQAVGTNAGTVTQNYAVAKNLDLSSIANFDPILAYSGNFDGLGYTLSNLTVNHAANNQALFGSTSGTTGSISNVILSAVNVTGNSLVGGLVGANTLAIRNSSVTSGTITGTTDVGGLVGNKSSGLIDSSSSGANVIAASQIAGGLVGTSTGGNITNSYATGNVTANGSGGSVFNVGGLVGVITTGSVSNSYSTGTVVATNLSDVGGLIGYLSSTSLSNSYSTSAVTGANSVGGLVGLMDGIATIANSYHTTGTVTGSGGSIGGLVGNTGATSITGSYNTAAVSGLSSATNIGGLIGTNATPVSTSYNEGTVTSTNSSGTASIGGLIGSNAAAVTDSYTKATATVSASGGQVGGLIGSSTAGVISGSYTQNGVTGLASVGGLIGVISGGSITGSHSEGAVSSSGSQTGGLVGSSVVAINNSYSTSNVTGGTSTGGLVGITSTGSTISSSYSSGNVSGGSLVGGLVGAHNAGTLSGSYATGSVTGTGGFVGGLIGRFSGISTADSVYSSGFVTSSGTANIGGLMGSMNFGTLTNAYSTSTVLVNNATANVGGLIGVVFAGGASVSNSFSAGYVAAPGAAVGAVGALIGNNGGAVSNSFWNNQTSGQGSTGVGTNSGTLTNVTGQTTAALMTLTPFTTGGATWDFSTKWGLIANQSYPYPLAIFSSTPTVISGIAYSVPTSVSVGGGSQIKFVDNGVQFATATTGANGFYYNIFGNGTFAANEPLLMYLNSSAVHGIGGGFTGNSIVKLGSGSATGLDIYNNAVRVRNDSVTPISNTTLSTLKGGLVDSNILYSVSGTDLTLTSGKSFNAYTGPYQLNGNVTASGGINFDGAVTLSSASILNAGAADIGLNSTVNGAFDLTLSTSGGNITFNGVVGGVTPLTQLIITNANNVTGNANVTAGNFIQQSGSGTTSFGSHTLTGTSGVNISTGYISGTDFNTDGLMALNGLNGMVVNLRGGALFVNGLHGGTLTGSLTTGFPGLYSRAPGAQGLFTFNGILIGQPESTLSTSGIVWSQSNLFDQRIHDLYLTRGDQRVAEDMAVILYALQEDLLLTDRHSEEELRKALERRSVKKPVLALITPNRTSSPVPFDIREMLNPLKLMSPPAPYFLQKHLMTSYYH